MIITLLLVWGDRLFLITVWKPCSCLSVAVDARILEELRQTKVLQHGPKETYSMGLQNMCLCSSPYNGQSDSPHPLVGVLWLSICWPHLIVDGGRNVIDVSEKCQVHTHIINSYSRHLVGNSQSKSAMTSIISWHFNPILILGPSRNARSKGVSRHTGKLTQLLKTYFNCTVAIKTTVIYMTTVNYCTC